MNTENTDFFYKKTKKVVAQNPVGQTAIEVHCISGLIARLAVQCIFSDATHH